MAVGDIINVNLNNLTSYQPASGVEIYILKSMRSNSYGIRVGFQDGTTTTTNYSNAANSLVNRPSDFSKFGITNTNYYYVQSSLADGGFSGIQIK